MQLVRLVQRIAEHIGEAVIDIAYLAGLIEHDDPVAGVLEQGLALGDLVRQGQLGLFVFADVGKTPTILNGAPWTSRSTTSPRSKTQTMRPVECLSRCSLR